MSGLFTANLSGIVEKAKGKVDVAVRKVALELFRDVVVMSPVLSGRFRANWQVGFGTVPFGISDSTDWEGTMPYIEAALGSYTPVGESIFLVNNLPYAQRLEYGYSKKAPDGMVRISLENFKNHYGVV